MWDIKIRHDKRKWDLSPMHGVRQTWSMEATKRKPVEAIKKAPISIARRMPSPNESLAYCDDCQEWTPMTWLPIGERGRTAETWFECEYCGGRKLTLKYMSQKEAVRLNINCMESKYERKHCGDGI